ncbi:cysteine peptidase family C39 domain-containing protein [Parahaliea aestuarii]|uniref:Peptidase C39 domain-containing protein n=1 Tax=Parahaliea aestuarii TaxID=1852021 RepID=A0A5C8ZMN6_9GAMM|nr:cysteine peptidase family C39 domain-containing protein [Parahaliea aestuarii]TXS89024.1 hypothetical protein FVW59_19050 [Parahaliea aestuarii]
MIRFIYNTAIVLVMSVVTLLFAMTLHTVSLLVATPFSFSDVLKDVEARIQRPTYQDSIAQKFRSGSVIGTGRTALAYTLARFGESVDLDDVGIGLHPPAGRDTLAPRQITRAGRVLGYQVALEESFRSNELPVIGLHPAIAEMVGGLYVVLHQISENSVTLFDPRIGRVITISRNDFQSQWNGIVIRLIPGLLVRR